MQEWPDVCFGLGNYVAVWTDLRNSVERIITTARVTPQWIVLDTGIVVGANSAYQITPVIAFDNSRFLVAWQNLASPFGIYCRFLGGDGQPQDSVMTISSAVTAANPRIIFGGSKYLIVWQEYTTTNHIVGRFVSPDGVLLGDEIVITSGTANHVSPAVCYDGNKYLVVWSENQIWGQFLTDEGSSIGAALPISTVMNDQVDPDVIFGGGKFLTIWSEFRTDYDIYGNLDAQIGVCESNDDASLPENVHPDRTVFTDVVKLVGGHGANVSVFNVLGERVDIVSHGIWDARSHPPGIYFLSWEDGYACRVVRVK
jgi:hypothetical protein